jgi:hypothetical protein
VRSRRAPVTLAFVLGARMTLGGRDAKAAAPDPASEGAGNAIDDAVCQDHEHAHAWNEAWAVTFGAAALASAGLATFAPSSWFTDNTRAGLYVTAAKATIGVASKLVEPLEVDVKGLCGDRRPQSRRRRHVLLNEIARREKRAIVPSIIGGLVLNSFGLFYMGYVRHAWESGWISFGIGSGVAVASVLTAPTQSWLLRRRMTEGPRLAVVPRLGPGAASLALVGLF